MPSSSTRPHSLLVTAFPLRRSWRCPTLREDVGVASAATSLGGPADLRLTCEANTGEPFPRRPRYPEPVLIAAFPAGPWGTNCYVVATGPGSECVVIDPGKDAAEGVARVVREHRLKPVAVLVTHGHVDHMWCVAPVAGAYDATAWIHPARPAPAGRPDGRACRRETRAMMLGGELRVRRARRRPRARRPAGARARRAELRRRPHAGPHRGLGHLPHAVRRRAGSADVSEVMFSGDLLFAGSIGRTDLPGGDHPAMLRSLATRCCRWPTTSWCCPATASRPPSAASAPPTRSCRTCPRLADEQPMTDKLTPLSGFPELLPEQRVVEQRGRRPAARHLRAARLRQHRDPRRRAARPAAAQGRDLQGDLRPAPAAATQESGKDAGLGPALRPHRAVRALRRSRTPASSSSRSAATRSRRSGAASGPRRAATASSPRPTSTSSAATCCRSTTTSRWSG